MTNEQLTWAIEATARNPRLTIAYAAHVETLREAAQQLLDQRRSRSSSVVCQHVY